MPFANSLVKTFGNGAEFVITGSMVPTSIRLVTGVSRDAGRLASGEPARLPRPAGAAARAYHGQVNDLRTLEAWIDDRFPALAEAYGVPGAAVAILADGDMIDAPPAC